MGHILQSAAWGAFQENQGNSTFSAEGEGWSVLAALDTTRSHTPRMYAAYGPSFQTDEALAEALSALEDAAKKRDAVYVRVEPVGPSEEAEAQTAEKLTALGYHKVDHIQPEDTWLVDVSRPWDDVFMDMDPNHRRRYRGMEKRSIEVTSSTNPDDIRYLSDLMAQVEDRDSVELRDYDYLHAQADVLMNAGAATLYMATAPVIDGDGDERKVVSCDFVFQDDDTVYMMHNGTDGAYYKTGANVAMQVQIVRDACEQGRKWVDFCGIAPEGSGKDHPWAGFSRFKQGFGGQYRHYLGTWEKPIKKMHYALYETARKIASSD